MQNEAKRGKEGQFGQECGAAGGFELSVFGCFELVSSFGIRISDLAGRAAGVVLDARRVGAIMREVTTCRVAVRGKRLGGLVERLVRL